MKTGPVESVLSAPGTRLVVLGVRDAETRVTGMVPQGHRQPPGTGV